MNRKIQKFSNAIIIWSSHLPGKIKKSATMKPLITVPHCMHESFPWRSDLFIIYIHLGQPHSIYQGPPGWKGGTQPGKTPEKLRRTYNFQDLSPFSFQLKRSSAEIIQTSYSSWFLAGLWTPTALQIYAEITWSCALGSFSVSYSLPRGLRLVYDFAMSAEEIATVMHKTGGTTGRLDIVYPTVNPQIAYWAKQFTWRRITTTSICFRSLGFSVPSLQYTSLSLTLSSGCHWCKRTR